jgi:hypothetical protein
MAENAPPPLKPLHPESSLLAVKLAAFERMSTAELARSLLPGTRDSLKTRPDGTIIDGQHRVCVLRRRGMDVDDLPRDVIGREDF